MYLFWHAFMQQSVYLQFPECMFIYAICHSALKYDLYLRFLLQPAPPAMSYQMAYGNQPVSMAPPGMPGAQMYYAGGYPPTLSQQQMQQPAQGSVHVHYYDYIAHKPWHNIQSTPLLNRIC